MGQKEQVSLPIAPIDWKLQPHYAATMFSSPKLMVVLNNHRPGVWGRGRMRSQVLVKLCA